MHVKQRLQMSPPCLNEQKKREFDELQSSAKHHERQIPLHRIVLHSTCGGEGMGCRGKSMHAICCNILMIASMLRLTMTIVSRLTLT